MKFEIAKLSLGFGKDSKLNTFGLKNIGSATPVLPNLFLHMCIDLKQSSKPSVLSEEET
jgi:hypothetical protein